MPGELTDRNNAAVVQINGVRDRLRVLLVSGEPHAGERVWRNLLKSDPSVDLVHFTILRPPEKQDGVPVEELSLIAFPTRELFVEKINEFDLIIFDRYRMRGILPMEYIDNIVSYVKNGGTVLVAAGPEFGAVDSLWRSPLAEILPVEPTSQVIEEGFRPKITDLGKRHPVTEGLETFAPPGGWGRWFRPIEVTPLRGQVVMSGAEDKPLLVLDRVGEGRVAVLASDQAWLWARGFEGGGPQLELLRRLAHWMLKEPELEEEALNATVNGDVLTITRRTLAETPPGDVAVTGPDGAEVVLPLTQTDPGKYSTTWKAPVIGLYRLEQGDLMRVIAVGPAAPREFVDPLATGDLLQPVVAPTNGGILRLEDGMPSIRTVREGRPAVGRGWIGITPRGAYVTEDLRVDALLPAWLLLVLAAGLAVAAWLVEASRKRRVQPPTPDAATQRCDRHVFAIRAFSGCSCARALLYCGDDTHWHPCGPFGLRLPRLGRENPADGFVGLSEFPDHGRDRFHPGQRRRLDRHRTDLHPKAGPGAVRICAAGQKPCAGQRRSGGGVRRKVQPAAHAIPAETHAAEPDPCQERQPWSGQDGGGPHRTEEFHQCRGARPRTSRIRHHHTGVHRQARSPCGNG